LEREWFRPSVREEGSSGVGRVGAHLAELIVNRWLRQFASVLYAIWGHEHVSGDVQVGVTVDKNGDVNSANFANGHPLLEKAATDAARRWKFEKLRDELRVQLTFSFRIVPKDTSAADMTFAVSCYRWVNRGYR
jgi:TonB family protein